MAHSRRLVVAGAAEHDTGRVLQSRPRHLGRSVGVLRDDGRGRCDDEGGDGRRVSREQRDGPSESFITGFRRDRYGCVNEAEAAGMSAPVRAVVHAMEPRPLLRAEEERLLLRRVHVAPPAARVPPKRFAIHSCMSKVWLAVDTGERLEPDNVRRGIYHDGEDAIEDLDACLLYTSPSPRDS